MPFWVSTSLTVVLTGIANIFLIKEKKLTDPIHKMWVHIFELKFVLSLFLTPMIYPISGFYYHSQSEQTFVINEESDDIFDA